MVMQHMNCEGNVSADLLGKKGATQMEGLKLLDLPLAVLGLLLKIDHMRVLYPRG